MLDSMMLNKKSIMCKQGDVYNLTVVNVLYCTQLLRRFYNIIAAQCHYLPPLKRVSWLYIFFCFYVDF